MSDSVRPEPEVIPLINALETSFPDSCTHCLAIQREAMALAVHANDTLAKMKLIMANANGPGLRDLYLKERTALWSGNVRVLLCEPGRPPKTTRIVGKPPEGYTEVPLVNSRTAFSYFPLGAKINVWMLIWRKNLPLEKLRMIARGLGCFPMLRERRAQRRALFRFAVTAGRWAAFQNWLRRMP